MGIAYVLLQTMPVHANNSTEISSPEIVEVQEKEDWETPSGICAEDFEEICDEEFEAILGTKMAGGAITVVAHGEVVFSKGYGYADAENQLPFSPSGTVFEYGSVSKLFTWTSAMQMEEQGKPDLNENIDNYLGDFQRVDEKKKPVTMLQLMNHQAGYGDYLVHLFSREEENLVSLKEGLKENKVSQVCEPGFASCYSNYGAALAGLVVENIVGEPLYQYIENQIFEPLGMMQTRMNPVLEDSLKLKKSKAYVTDGKELVQGNWSYVSMYPAGSVNGTLEDLSKFAIAFLEKNPVLFHNEDTFYKMLSPSYEVAPGVEGIAHGFIEFEGEYPTFWHNGGTENFSTFLAIVPEADFAIIACGNTEESISMIQPLCFSMLEKKSVTVSTPQEQLPDISILEGKYQDFREVQKGILQIISLFREPVSVTVIGENQISVDGETYAQIEPYVFQSLETGRKCGFLVEDGKVIKFSDMLDYLPVSMPVRVRNFVTFAIFFLFLGITAITWITFVMDVIKKRKNSIHKFFLVENAIMAVILFIIFLVIGEITSWKTAEAFSGYQMGNCGLACLLSVLDIGGIAVTRKDRTKGIWLYRVYSGILLLFLGLMATWGLFSVSG